MANFKSIRTNIYKSYLQFRKDTYKANQKGFLLVSVITITPLLLSICFLIVGFANYSYLHTRALNLCRKHLLIGQDKIQYQMRKLIKLNSKAEDLREEHDKALKKLMSSVPPTPAYAAALINYGQVIARQTLFAARQQRHISIAKAYGKTQTKTLQYKIKKLNSDARIEVESFPFALERQQPLSLTPNYSKSSNFKENQMVKARWTMKNFNKIINNHYINQAEKKSIITGTCGATIETTKGKKWKAQLMKKGRL